MASSEPLLPRDEGSNGGQQTIAVSLASIVPSADSGERDDDQRQPGNIEFLGQLKVMHVGLGLLSSDMWCHHVVPCFQFSHEIAT